MATFTKQQLSGSSNGRAVKVAASSTPGTTIHTATSTANQFDEVHLWAVNSDTTARKLTIELGGTSSPDDLIEQTIPPESGLVYVVPGLPLDGGVVVKAFCASANQVMLHGYTNRIDQS